VQSGWSKHEIEEASSVTHSIGDVWPRIEAHAGEDFKLIGRRVFQYEVPGNYLRPIGRVRHLSRTNFSKALDRLPLHNTGSVRDLQGPSYVFAILMDDRIRRGEW
jgi:hypothetical protein